MKSILYKDRKDLNYELQIIRDKGYIEFHFENDGGKFGTYEPIFSCKITPERLLEILSERNDFTEEELDV